MSKDRIRLPEHDRLVVIKALRKYVESEQDITEAWRAYEVAKALVVRPKGPRERWQEKEDDKELMLKEMDGWIDRLRTSLRAL